MSIQHFPRFPASRALVFLLLLWGCSPSNPPVTTAPDAAYSWQEFSMGVDLSYLPQVEDYGGVFRDSGRITDALSALRRQGANTVRVRLWHTPQWVADLNRGKMYSDLAGVTGLIRRAKAAGMAVNLDIHYSDRWADPQHQDVPAAWKGLPIELLEDSLYRYTLSVLQQLAAQGLTPEMVQVGNETNTGMCWPLGRAGQGDYRNFARLLNSGIRAVRAFAQASPLKPQVILHVAQFQDAHAWAAGITAEGVRDFDILGVSHYTKWSQVKTMQGVADSVRALTARFGKKVMVVETAYPWTGDNADAYPNIFAPSDAAPGYGISPTEQLRYLRDLTQAVMDGGGTGLQYWEPAWISSRLNDGWNIGSAWDNNTLFDFRGNLLPGAGFMRNGYRR
jgi:arabinogalactan endo-1,4-beta-galactosidase